MGATAILSLRILGDGKPAKKELDKTAKAVDSFQKGVGKAGLATGAALTAGLVGAVNADGANRKLAAGLGLSGPEAAKAGQIAGSLFTSGLGESMQDVNAAVDGVASTLASMGTNGGADVERLSQKALTLGKTFGTDVNAAINSAGIVMKSGLAKDADQAFDLIAGSMQKMPAAMRDELMPVMDEYAIHFEALGIKGPAAFDMITKSAANGAIGMDKTGDALKEFQIRATDMSKTSGEAYKTLGMSQEAMSNKLLAGGDSANAAFGQIVQGLGKIKDPAKRAEAAIALFGTPLEDLGVNQIPEFLAMIDPMNAGVDSMAGKMDEMGKVVNDGPSMAFAQLQRTATSTFVAIGASALPVLQPILDLLIQFAPVLGPIALGIAAIAAVTWGVTAAQSAWTMAVTIGRGAVMAAQAAQVGWNLAMSANPIGVVIALIAGLTAGVIWAYENVGWFRDGVDAAGVVAQAVFTAIGGFISGVVTWVVDLVSQNTVLSGAFETVGAVGRSIFDGINGAIQSTIGWVKDAIGWFGSLFSSKEKANSVSVDTGSNAGRSAPPPPSAAPPAAPMMMATTFASPVASASFTTLAAAPTALPMAPSVSSEGLSRSGKTVIVKQTVNVEFKGVVTDKIGTAREIKRLLEDEAKLVGS